MATKAKKKVKRVSKKTAKKKVVKKKRVPEKQAAPITITTAAAKVIKQAQKDKAADELLTEAREILPRLQAGETTVGAERDRLGHKNNSKIRAALIEVLGSRDAYFELLHLRQKQRGVPNGGVVAVFSDKDVPQIPSTKYADGWTSGTIITHEHRVSTFTSPDGVTYVIALNTERADLLVGPHPDTGIARLRIYSTSSKAKQVKKENKLLEHNGKAVAAKQADKKKKLVRRKK